MKAAKPIEIKGYFRAYSHLPVWEIVERAGIWEQLGVRATFEFCGGSTEAETALLEGRIDFVSGNHISPYALIARGKPLVCLASPSNGVRDSLVSREPIQSVSDLRGQRIADTSVLGADGEYRHMRGNHNLYVMHAGLRLDEVRWVELSDSNNDDFRAGQFRALQEAKADATFVTGSAEKYQQAGFHVLQLERLSMVNGPTLTTTTETLRRNPGLAERLVKALVLGIHYAKTRREKTEGYLEDLKKRLPGARGISYNGVAKLLAKPYPDLQAIGHAYELCCAVAPEAKEVSPLKLWNLHYLRNLDDEGFIDRLYAENRANA